MDFHEKLCPFCKKDNNCNILNASKCWCMSTKVPEGLKDLVPRYSKDKSCICQSCVETYKKNKEEFILKYINK